MRRACTEKRNVLRLYFVLPALSRRVPVHRSSSTICAGTTAIVRDSSASATIPKATLPRPQAKLLTGEMPRLLADRRLRRPPPPTPPDDARGSAVASAGRALQPSSPPPGRTPSAPEGATTSVMPTRPIATDQVPPRRARSPTDAATAAVTAAVAAAAGRAAVTIAATSRRRTARTAAKRERSEPADGAPAVTTAAVWTARNSAPIFGGGATSWKPPCEVDWACGVPTVAPLSASARRVRKPVRGRADGGGSDVTAGTDRGVNRRGWGGGEVARSVPSRRAGVGVGVGAAAVPSMAMSRGPSPLPSPPASPVGG